MKKTFIVLMALAGTTIAATNITLTSGGDITAGLSDDIISAITTVGNSDYTLQMSGTPVSYTINNDLYVYTFEATSQSTITIDFGVSGSITAAHHMNFYQKSATTWNIKVADNVLEGLGVGELYERTLLSTAGGNWGIWNLGSNDNNTVFTYATFNDIDSLNSFTNKGIINNSDVNTLKAGEYALVFTEGGQQAGDNLRLVIVAPEPTTATLSLLALAGLAARRRRK